MLYRYRGGRGGGRGGGRKNQDVYRAHALLPGAAGAISFDRLPSIQTELRHVYDSSPLEEATRTDLYLDEPLVTSSAFKEHTTESMRDANPKLHKKIERLRDAIETNIPIKEPRTPLVDMSIITTNFGSEVAPYWHTDRNSAMTEGYVRAEDMTINAKDQTPSSMKLIGIITVPLADAAPTEFADPYSAKYTEGQGNPGSASLFHPLEYHSSPGSVERTILLVTFVGSDAYTLQDLQDGFSRAYEQEYQKAPSASFIVGSTDYARLITPEEGSLVDKQIVRQKFFDNKIAAEAARGFKSWKPAPGEPGFKPDSAWLQRQEEARKEEEKVRIMSGPKAAPPTPPVDNKIVRQTLLYYGFPTLVALAAFVWKFGNMTYLKQLANRTPSPSPPPLLPGAMQQCTFAFDMLTRSLDVERSKLPSDISINHPVNLVRPTPKNVAPTMEQWANAARVAIRDQVDPFFREKDYSLVFEKWVPIAYGYLLKGIYLKYNVYK